MANGGGGRGPFENFLTHLESLLAECAGFRCSPAMNLDGKVALVTGSAQGIGQAIAVRLAKDGADVIVADLDESKCAETKAEIEKLGRKALVIPDDISCVMCDQATIDHGVAEFGKIDILVNNAGVERRGDFWDVEEADFDFVMNINLRGTFFLTRNFVRHLRATKRPGRIINISSVHEELPFPHFSTYCASKGALKMLCRDLAIELGPLGITVNNVAPGAIETPINTKLLNNPDLMKALLSQIPLNRLGKPGDVAGITSFLASDDAAYITGSTFVVDGGLLWNYHEQ